MNKIKIELYKWAGKFGPIEIKTTCGECSLNKGVIIQAIKEFEEDGDFIEFEEKPWLNNWIKLLFKGAWHAPIVVINGKVVGQEKVLTKEKIKDEIMKILYKDYTIPSGTHIFTLPNCPYCKRAKEILQRNNIRYHEHNVIEKSSNMMKVLSLVTGKIHPITMPQIFINKVWIKGSDELEELEKENKLNELANY